MPDLGNWGQYGRLTPKAPYGRHIGLRCKVHPDCTYHTKNIAPIGARSIFADNRDCPCGIENLELIPIDGPDVPE
jgi:hypothetical protein